MKRNIFSLTMLSAFLAVAGLAADKPNFSGTWVLNEGKSVFPEMPQGAPGGGGAGGGRGRMMGGSATRTIVHEDPKITTSSKMKSRDGQEVDMVTVITTDGKSSTNKGGPRGGTSKTKGGWEGSKLKMNTEREMSTPNGDFTITSTEEWTLSNDGKQMTILSKFSTPMGETEATLVYDKQ